MQSPQSAPFRTMVARVSPDDIVIYANAALAAYLGVSKKHLIGTPLDVLAQRVRGEISGCFARLEGSRSNNRLVTDDAGRVFEAKSYVEGGSLDIVLDEVTTAESIARELRGSSGTPYESLTEDELRTTRNPERRYLTVSFTSLRELAPLADRLAPMDVRLMVNSFVEEACDAVFETGCTVGETSGDSILGIYGAPRYFADHPLRAIHAACDQMQKAAHLHAGFYREGKELPPCSCGIWTGDTLVGTLGNSAWQHYTAIGSPVDFAQKLSALARAGEILIPEHTLTHLLRVLPEGWQHVRAESEAEPDLSDFQWEGTDVVPVAEHLRKVVYLVGRGVQESVEGVEFYFDYMWALRIPERDQVIPILRVVRPAAVGDTLALNQDNVIASPAVQMLGKYKLIEVLGVGGMGRVWRGTDRFGNSVAIKVLHSTETVTDSQLKRFRREAEVMAKLPHRNICRVYEMNEFDGIQYIAMEYISGLPLSDLLYEKTAGESDGKSAKPDLRTLIKSLRMERVSREQAASAGESTEAPPRAKVTRILPLEQTLNIFLKVCEAVQFAHEHGVLHRDIKPGNILLREDGEPLVADFGLAKLNDADATHSLSLTGHVVGTMENMAPEQAESSKDVDERADVYSLGTILYQMLTGRRHFEATGNIVTDAQALKTHVPVRPRTINPHIDPDLEIITLKALRIEPPERYRNVAAFKEDIERYRKGEVITAKPVSALDLAKKLIQRNRAVSAVILASLFLFIVGGVASFYMQNQQLLLARAARAEAEKAQAQAQWQEGEAIRLKKIADEQLAEATKANEKFERALKDKQDAEAARTLAQEESQKAAQTSAEAQAKLAAAEEENQKRAAELQDLQKEQEKMQAAAALVGPQPDRPSGGPAGSNGLSPEDNNAIRRLMREPTEIVNMQLSAPELARMDKIPQEVVRRLTRAMDGVSQAIAIDPNFLPGWMFKGRLHLSLMEFGLAVESFQQAVKLSSLPQWKDFIARDDPSTMLSMATDISRGWGDKYEKGADTLRASNLPPNQSAGNILRFLASKPSLRKSSSLGSGPLGREMTPSEVAVFLAARNGAASRVIVDAAQAGQAKVVIANGFEFRDLSTLKELDVTMLTLQGAKFVDWVTVIALPIEVLDISNCEVSVFPPNPRGFLHMRVLNLSQTGIASLDFARWMPLLEALNISRTNVTDIAPLLACRALRQLDISNSKVVNVAPLKTSLVDTLTLSPALVDKASLATLRVSRLRIIRSPDDPPDQSAAEFWRKYDSGIYGSSN